MTNSNSDDNEPIVEKWDRGAAFEDDDTISFPVSVVITAAEIINTAHIMRVAIVFEHKEVDSVAALLQLAVDTFIKPEFRFLAYYRMTNILMIPYNLDDASCTVALYNELHAHKPAGVLVLERDEVNRPIHKCVETYSREMLNGGG